MGKMILTCTDIKNFRSCQMKYNARTNMELASKTVSPAIGFGRLWHGVMERWYTPPGSPLHMSTDPERRKAEVLMYIDVACINRDTNPEAQKNRNLAIAMFKSYVKRYPTEPWTVVSVEQKFAVPLINPKSHRSSRLWEFWGVCDVLMELPEWPNAYWVMEHKSARTIDTNYIERLPLDLQVNGYAEAMSRFIGKPVIGVIYNAVTKKQLKQREGETEEEFQFRYAEACKKNKSGKSNVQQQIAETDEEFQARLIEAYAANPDELFYREPLLFDANDRRRVLEQVWQYSQQILMCRRKKCWTLNDDQCFAHGKQPCEYHMLCRSGFNQAGLEARYEHKPAHTELYDDEDNDDGDSNTAA